MYEFCLWKEHEVLAVLSIQFSHFIQLIWNGIILNHCRGVCKFPGQVPLTHVHQFETTDELPLIWPSSLEARLTWDHLSRTHTHTHKHTPTLLLHMPSSPSIIAILPEHMTHNTLVHLQTPDTHTHTHTHTHSHITLVHLQTGALVSH